ncbi:MAG: O-antigen ligase family protein [Firmicutes bacterium]|nr:O-antigen ligase family protein [Bacillota bacterium]
MNKINLTANKRMSYLFYTIITIAFAALASIAFGVSAGILVSLSWVVLPFAIKYRFHALNLFLIGYAFLPDALILACEFLFFAIFILDIVVLKKKFKLNSMIIPILLIIVLAIINSFTGLNVIGSMRDLAMNFGAFFTMLLLVQETDSKERLNTILTSISIGAFLVAIFGLFQFTFMGSVNREWIDKSLKDEITRRAYSVFYNPNIFAEYIVLTTPIAVAQFWANKDRFKKFVYLGIVGTLLLNLMLTFSRGGLVAIAVAAIVFLFFTLRSLIFFSMPFAALGFNFLPESIQNRIISIFNFADTSTSYRFRMWEITTDVIRDHPTVGVGFGHKTFKQVFEQYIRSMPIFHAHNTYLEVLAETGFVGLIAFLYLIVVSFINVIKSGIKSSDYYIRVVSAAVLASAAGILAHGMFEHIVYINRIIVMLWVILGLSYIIKNITKIENKE